MKTTTPRPVPHPCPWCGGALDIHTGIISSVNFASFEVGQPDGRVKTFGRFVACNGCEFAMEC